MPQTGTCYVVATPIGNLGDLSPRAVEALKACAVIAAEDTRRSRQLLTHFGVTGKDVVALHAHSSDRDVARLVARLEAGDDVAVVTDAGTPVVSDPGESLVRAAIALGARVVPIPGASAVLAALAASGLGGGGFRFVGFLPRDARPRADAIARLCAEPDAVVLFESPNRARDTLAELAAATPERSACVARELTKLHEEFVRGSLADLAALEREWIGEITMVLGPHDPTSRELRVDEASIDARIDHELTVGTHPKRISELIAAWSGRPKREIYERVVRRK